MEATFARCADNEYLDGSVHWENPLGQSVHNWMNNLPKLVCDRLKAFGNPVVNKDHFVSAA
jgi:hypothetical protein